MIRIIDGRGTGKTSRLVLLAKENNLPIAASNPTDLRDKMRTYGITGVAILSYHDAATYPQPFLVDELEMFTQYLIKGKLKGYTLSQN